MFGMVSFPAKDTQPFSAFFFFALAWSMCDSEEMIIHPSHVRQKLSIAQCDGKRGLTAF